MKDKFEGFPNLASHIDLFKKLEWEYEQFNADNKNVFIAYNLFVTAWHLLEWEYPGSEGKVFRDSIKDSNPIIQICEHLAVGAKHFKVSNTKLNSVSGSKQIHSWGWQGAWQGAWDGGGSQLVVILEGQAAQTLGPSISIDVLSQLVMEFWKGRHAVVGELTGIAP